MGPRKLPQTALFVGAALLLAACGDAVGTRDLGFADAGLSDLGAVYPDAEPRDLGIHPDAEPRDLGIHPDAEPRDTGIVPDSGIVTDTGPIYYPFEGRIEFDDNRTRAVEPSTLPARPRPCKEPELVRIYRVVDGDTIYVEPEAIGGTEGAVRIIGVDTPEIGRNGAEDECYAPEARAFSRIITNRLVWLTFGTDCLDRFNRNLAYVHFSAEPGGSWTRQLLRRGYGKVLTISPNDFFEWIFEADEGLAKSRMNGLWGNCPQ